MIIYVYKLKLFTKKDYVSIMWYFKLILYDYMILNTLIFNKFIFVNK